MCSIEVTGESCSELMGHPRKEKGGRRRRRIGRGGKVVFGKVPGARQELIGGKQKKGGFRGLAERLCAETNSKKAASASQSNGSLRGPTIKHCNTVRRWACPN